MHERPSRAQGCRHVTVTEIVTSARKAARAHLSRCQGMRLAGYVSHWAESCGRSKGGSTGLEGGEGVSAEGSADKQLAYSA